MSGWWFIRLYSGGKASNVVFWLVLITNLHYFSLLKIPSQFATAHGQIRNMFRWLIWFWPRDVTLSVIEHTLLLSPLLCLSRLNLGYLPITPKRHESSTYYPLISRSGISGRSHPSTWTGIIGLLCRFYPFCIQGTDWYGTRSNENHRFSWRLLLSPGNMRTASSLDITKSPATITYS